MLTGVLFDWDGTLCDTLPVCVEAFRRTMITYLGKNLSDEEIMEHFGVNELGIIMIKLRNQPENWQTETVMNCLSLPMSRVMFM